MLAAPPPASRARSMDVLNEPVHGAKEQHVVVPENDLQKLTVHQARIQKSLDKLNVPSWYRGSAAQGGEPSPWRRSASRTGYGGWRRAAGGTQSAVTSRPTTPLCVTERGTSSSTANTPRGDAADGAPANIYRSSYSRWSTHHLNSRDSSTLPPSSSTRPPTAPSPAHSSFSIKSWQSSASSTAPSTSSILAPKQPYLGWRSQERLSHPAAGGGYLVTTPAQRLASSSIGGSSRKSSTLPPGLPATPGPGQKANNTNMAVHDSIKKVTEAIVDYCSEGDNSKHQGNKENGAVHETDLPYHQDGGLVRNGGPHRLPSSGASGRPPVRRVWMESSFVSTKGGEKTTSSSSNCDSATPAPGGPQASDDGPAPLHHRHHALPPATAMAPQVSNGPVMTGGVN